MEFPQECLVSGAKGKKEARVLRSLGAGFVVYGYFDIDAQKPLAKYSILLRKESGEIEHLFIVPTGGGKELVVKHETEKNGAQRGIFDTKEKNMIYF
jgi:hypothetical protein